jgi:hypothetical protein
LCSRVFAAERILKNAFFNETKESMNIIRTVTVIALLVTPLFGQKFPAQIKKSVTFIYSRDSTNRLSVQGTGFFVLMQSSMQADTATFGYLVTTRTALKKRNGQMLDTVYVRINRKDGSVDTLLVQLNGTETPRCFFHPDSTVDLAVIPAYPDAQRYDMLYIPASLIAAADFFSRENIAEGSELFYTGVLKQQTGMFKNIPVVRYGRIVQLSNEKYQWEGRFAEFFLLESSAHIGTTGSPVYYYTEAVRDTGSAARSARLMLCGIAAGPFGNGPDDQGFTRVIPAYTLNELLALPAVAAEREKEFIRMQERSKK